MVLTLRRTYFPDGTNGIITRNGKAICHTIELPWRNNQRSLSCIPEGKYLLKKRYSAKFGWHIEITGVVKRSLVLFHPANNALLELNGCIAPVTKICGAGKGLMSRQAFSSLKAIIYQALDEKQTVSIIIKS